MASASQRSDSCRFGRSRWISGEAAREYVQWLRAGFDAIAVGGRTARLDDPSLTVRGPVRPLAAPRRVVFDRAADLGPHLTMLRTAGDTPTIIVVAPEADRARVKRLEAAGASIVRTPKLAEALAALRELGVASLLVEGGGQLAGALAAAALAIALAALGAGLATITGWLGGELVGRLSVGVDDGAQLRVSGRGEAGVRGGGSGAL